MLKKLSKLVSNLNLNAIFLNDVEARSIADMLNNNLKIDLYSDNLWGKKDSPSGCLKRDGWSLITNYFKQDKCVLILPQHRVFLYFQSGEDLFKLLSEAPGFEFYVCNQNSTSLLCFNDHDYVIGWGDAASWVHSLTPDYNLE